MFGRIAKALVAAVIAGASSIQVALGDNSLTSTEIVTAIVAAFLAGTVVWGVPNTVPSVTQTPENFTGDVNG